MDAVELTLQLDGRPVLSQLGSAQGRPVCACPGISGASRNEGLASGNQRQVATASRRRRRKIRSRRDRRTNSPSVGFSASAWRAGLRARSVDSRCAPGPSFAATDSPFGGLADAGTNSRGGRPAFDCGACQALPQQASHQRANGLRIGQPMCRTGRTGPDVNRDMRGRQGRKHLFVDIVVADGENQR